MMNLVLAKTETARELSDIFDVARDRLPGSGKVADARRQAFEVYERAGLPHRRIEDWKYTDLRVLMREVLPPAPAPDAGAFKLAGTALKSHAIRACAGWCWSMAYSRHSCPIWMISTRDFPSVRFARCWKPVILRCRRNCCRPTVPTRW